jgi:hypothetical protein
MFIECNSNQAKKGNINGSKRDDEEEEEEEVLHSYGKGNFGTTI